MGRRKDANRIKRPQNSFFCFRNELLQRYKAADPSVRQKNFSKEAGALWKSMTPAEKAPYEAQAKEAKEAHKRAYPDYVYCPRRKCTSNDVDCTDTPRSTHHALPLASSSGESSTGPATPTPSASSLPGLPSMPNAPSGIAHEALLHNVQPITPFGYDVLAKQRATLQPPYEAPSQSSSQRVHRARWSSPSYHPYLSHEARSRRLDAQSMLMTPSHSDALRPPHHDTALWYPTYFPRVEPVWQDPAAGGPSNPAIWNRGDRVDSSSEDWNSNDILGGAGLPPVLDPELSFSDQLPSPDWFSSPPAPSSFSFSENAADATVVVSSGQGPAVAAEAPETSSSAEPHSNLFDFLKPEWEWPKELEDQGSTR